MATLANTLAFSRAQTQTDSNGLTDANGIIWGNEALLDYHRRLIDAGVDASGLQESYTDATAGTGTYLYPTDMIWLKAIELNYTNSNATDYMTARQVDVSNVLNGESFSSLTKNAGKVQPMFDDRGDWYEIYPTPTSSDDLTALIRIFYFLKPTEYTATSDTIAYPASIDYRILGWRIASNYLYSLGKIEEGMAFNQKYEERVKELIQTLSRGSQQPIQPTGLGITGWEF